MKKQALRKDFFMEIRKSMNRFVSIFLIVTLGVAFYAGLQATAPDMRDTGDAYFDEEKLMDLKVIGTMGLTDEDVEALQELDGVALAEGAWMTDVLYGDEGDQKVLHIESVTENFQNLTLTKGRLPWRANECFLDDEIAGKLGLSLGDRLYVRESLDEDEDGVLKNSTFMVVGIGSSPYYLSLSRGNSTLGSGEVAGAMYVIPEAFNLDVYSQIWLEAKGARKLNAFDDAYTELIDEVKAQVKGIEDIRCEARYDGIIADAEDALAEGRQKIEDAKQELEDGRAELEEGKEQLEESRAQLNDSQAQVDSYVEQLSGGSGTKEEQADLQARIDRWNARIASGWEQVNDAEKEIEENEQKLLDAEEEIRDAQEELADGETELEDLKNDRDGNMPKWSISTREDLTDYVGYGDNADRMASLAQVFPALFFLVAALISLTTMTRMVEEERTQIGTLKALGYGKGSIAMKYLAYAFLATMGGSVTGVLLGQRFLPYVIITAYGILYKHMNVMLLPYRMGSAAIATGIAVLCTTMATLGACCKELLDTPASLMRPPAPKEGKRVLLERVGLIWNHLNFSWKSTIRNLFRYKKRLFMTLFGISGCMALLLVGFGLRDSIMDVAVLQYEELQLYDGTIIESEDATEEERASLTAALDAKSQVTCHMQVYMKNLSMKKEKNRRDVYLIVPETTEGLENFVIFRDRETHEAYKLEDEGIIIGEKTAQILDVGVGDQFVICPDEGTEVTVTVSAICENYMLHYAYMSREGYEKAFGETPKYNDRLFCTDLDDEAEIEKVGTEILNEDAALSISYTGTIKGRLDDMLGTLNSVIIVLIVSAGLLAFVVLYNLNNININERKRELATLKVLGFYDSEVDTYVYRENILLTLIGAALGIFLGALLHRYVILTVEVDDCMFGRNIKPLSDVYAAALTCLFSVIVNGFMHSKLKKINMVESLKSVE